MLLLGILTGMSAAGVWLTMTHPPFGPCMGLFSGPVQCSSRPVHTYRCWAAVYRQMHHTSSEHGNMCKLAVRQQTWQPAKPLLAQRGTCKHPWRTAHISRHACSTCRPSAQLTLQEGSFRRQPYRQRRERGAVCAAHAAASGNREVDSASNTRAPSPLLKFVQDQFLPLALVTAMIIG